MTDYSELKKLAEAATKGPWSYDGSYVCPARVEDGTTYVETWRSVADCAQPENTKFIAAANPAVVLALIAENERLKLIEEAWKLQKDMPAALVEVMVENDRLRKDAERYRWLTSTAVYNGTLGIAGGWIDFEDKIDAQHQIDAAMSEEGVKPAVDTPEAATGWTAEDESGARVVYEQWAYLCGYVPWVEGGNSLKQDEARRLYAAIEGKEYCYGR